jgi:hypothetical protein
MSANAWCRMAARRVGAHTIKSAKRGIGCICARQGLDIARHGTKGEAQDRTFQRNRPSIFLLASEPSLDLDDSYEESLGAVQRGGHTMQRWTSWENYALTI